MSNVNIDNATIPNRVFLGKSYNKILLPKSLKIIANDAFRSLTVPQLDFSQCKDLETIGYNAFSGANIESKVLDFSQNSLFTKGVKDPGSNQGIFSGYNGHVILPRNMKETPIHAFAEFLGTLDIPTTLEVVADGAFMGAKPAQDITLPTTVHTIKRLAFARCTLNKLTLSPAIITIANDVFRGINIPKIDFSVCKGLESIGYNAFSGANIESKVLDFSQNALFTKGVKDPGSNQGIFSGYSGHVILPRNMKETPIHAFAEFLGTLDIPTTLEVVADGAFIGAKPAQDIALPTNVHTIKGRAFQESTISKLTLSPAITMIGNDAFRQINIPHIDFSICKNLETIGNNAFMWANVESKVLDFSQNALFTKGTQYQSYGIFSEYDGHVILPRNMKEIPTSAFAYFKGTVDMPTGLESIELCAFKNSSIKSISLPANLKMIQHNAFSGCKELTSIISLNTTPPALGNTVFNGVDKNSCKLLVPEEAVAKYKVADQWKDFFVDKVVLDKVDLTFAMDGKTYPYNGIRIGEYYWVDQNFYHKLNVRIGHFIGVENDFPMTQARLDKYMPCVRLNPDKYQVDIKDFEYYYGNYYHMESSRYMSQNGKMLENGKTEANGWLLPSTEDFEQLFGMCPTMYEPYVNGITVSFMLAAPLGQNPLAFDIEPDVPGSPYKTGWFSLSQDTYKFNMMPAGMKQNADETWSNGIPGAAPDGNHYGNIGDLNHLFYATGFWTRSGDYNFSMYIHDFLDVKKWWKWHNIRWCRKLTDQELGYKLYYNANIPDIVKLNLDEEAPAGYTELENGYLRGFYVQYILNNPNPIYTVAGLVNKLNYINKFPRSTKDATKKALETKTEDSSLNIYPNPVENILHINSAYKIDNVEIYNSAGSMVLNENNVNGSIDVSALTKGIYVLSIQTNGEIQKHKMVKK